MEAFLAAVVSSLPASGGRNTTKSREQMLLVCKSLSIVRNYGPIKIKLKTI